VTDQPKHFGTPPCCGYILSEPSVLDIDGCALPRHHQGPHEFREFKTGTTYQWEYDEEYDQDVYWKKPNHTKDNQ
jgi:hypothetical protein